jgi:membrane-bound lytic murein transglycosylase D
LQSGTALLQEELNRRGLELAVPIDVEQTRDWLKALQGRFEDEYVLDLSKLRPAAEAALPWLESSEELKPYADWLRSRMDYFRAAEELDRMIPKVPGPQTPPPKTPSKGTIPPPEPPILVRAKPTPEQQRRVWSRVLALEPWPEEAGKYVTRLKPVFTSEQVPGELVWIAEVESSFRPEATSPAGAAGLFQLMPKTAKQEGLSLWPWDQRRDPEKSARASARYLRSLHEEFKDWSLALAAYNAGDGKVRTLLKRHGTRSYDRIAAHLPAETQLYVPKVEAVVRRREGKALAELVVPR